jgi:hypothetical protein
MDDGVGMTNAAKSPTLSEPMRVVSLNAAQAGRMRRILGSRDAADVLIALGEDLAHDGYPHDKARSVLAMVGNFAAQYRSKGETSELVLPDREDAFTAVSVAGDEPPSLRVNIVGLRDVADSCRRLLQLDHSRPAWAGLTLVKGYLVKEGEHYRNPGRLRTLQALRKLHSREVASAERSDHNAERSLLLQQTLLSAMVHEETKGVAELLAYFSSVGLDTALLRSLSAPLAGSRLNTMSSMNASLAESVPLQTARQLVQENSPQFQYLKKQFFEGWLLPAYLQVTSRDHWRGEMTTRLARLEAAAGRIRTTQLPWRFSTDAFAFVYDEAYYSGRLLEVGRQAPIPRPSAMRSAGGDKRVTEPERHQASWRSALSLAAIAVVAGLAWLVWRRSQPRRTGSVARQHRE